MKAKHFITHMTISNDYYEVYLKDLTTPLFFPKQMPLRSLYQCIAETFDKNDWHYYETEETKVGPNDVVLDCGAAEGLFSLNIANRCAKVYAIEPLPQFINSMKLTFSKYKNVAIMPCALSDTSSRGYISESDISSSVVENGELSIEIDTIDNLFFNKGIKVDYIKADIEGYEIKMLQGAENTIKAYKPKIAITTYHASSHATEIELLLKKWNPAYKIKTKGIEERHGSPVMLHAW